MILANLDREGRDFPETFDLVTPMGKFHEAKAKMDAKKMKQRMR